MTKARSLFSRDGMNNAPQKGVAQLASRVIDFIQDWRPEHQLLALATAFLLVAEASRIPAQDVFTASKNLMQAREDTQTGLCPEFQAIQYYLNKEVLKNG